MSGNTWFFGGMWAGVVFAVCLILDGLAGHVWRGVALGTFTASLIWYCYNTFSYYIQQHKDTPEPPDYRSDINRLSRD